MTAKEQALLKKRLLARWQTAQRLMQFNAAERDALINCHLELAKNASDPDEATVWYCNAWALRQIGTTNFPPQPSNN